MKFGKYFENMKISKWNEYYVDYRLLKNYVKNEDSDTFLITLKNELDKINDFVEKRLYKINSIDLNRYIVLNYMAFFKSIKKYDKKLCKTYKLQFYNTIKNELFYKTYLKLPRVFSDLKLIVFDKDGTLLDTSLMFSSWIKCLVDNIYNTIKENKKWECDKIFYREIENILQIDLENNTIQCDSVVAKGTNDDIRNILTNFLSKNGFSISEARFIVKKSWVDVEVNKNTIKLHANIINLFQTIRNNGIKVAICTSDDRKATEEFINHTKIEKLLDCVVCGDDNISSKPSPESLWKICSKLNIKPEESIMVGDTISDIHAGINAKFGKVISVLTGGYRYSDLTDADDIISSVNSLSDILQLQ